MRFVSDQIQANYTAKFEQLRKAMQNRQFRELFIRHEAEP